MLFHNTCYRVFQFLFLLAVLIMPLTLSAEDISVSFSASGGFYDYPFSLSLTCPEGYVIHYTTNGNTPKPSDPQYVSPLELNKSLYSRSNIYTIQTCADSSWFVPDTIQRCIVIRAAAFDAEGNQKSTVVTNSYFIKSLGIDLHGLPVISLCSDSLSLFDYETGILVSGITGSNYHQHGREWERLCNFEFYEPSNEGINQQIGLRTHGAASRGGIQKGLRLYARKEYGTKQFNYVFFEEDKNNNCFKHLVLKPVSSGLIRDHICSKIAQNLNFEVPQSRLAIVYLNGEYWGLYYLKERPDAHFIEDHFGYDKENVNIIESWSGVTTDGSNESFLEMMHWMMGADLSNPDTYEYAKSMIDIDCFIDYYCFQLFVANADWPDNNMRCWQGNNGKWRWIFHDGDYCLVSYRKMLSATLYSLENKDVSTILFSKLLANECFRNQFYERFGKLLTTDFYPKTTQRYFNQCLIAINKELDTHFYRFGFQDNKDDFDFQVFFMNGFLSQRMVSAAAMVYGLFYYNGWTYSNSLISSQSTFKYNPKRKPVFLFRMAMQFKDWKYVNRYFAYMRYRNKEDWKNSKLHQYLKQTKPWRWLKGES